jgi:hypothetical protein
VVRIRNTADNYTGTGTGTGTNISFRLINMCCGSGFFFVRIRNTADSYIGTGTGSNISFRLINTNEISVVGPDLCGTDLQHR